MLAGERASSITRADDEHELLVERIYYKENDYNGTKKQRNFEQSLDVYIPKTKNSARPLVVLVLGSAWMGHSAFIYIGTNWWNSRCPKALARQGFPCICIRHRGAFPKIFSWNPVVWTVLAPGVALGCCFNPATALFGLLLFLLSLLLVQKNDASMEDMVEDVADALVWVYRNRNMYSDKLAFGGYSSGGHVASCVLQRIDLFRKRTLPPPNEWIHCTLYLSAVLRLRLRNCDHRLPSFLVDSLLQCAFESETVSSPIEMVSKAPDIPHLLTGCVNELFFGLKWLDIFFAPDEYARLLAQRQVPAKYIAIRSANHWTVLSTPELVAALTQELSTPTVVENGITKHTTSSIHLPTKNSKLGHRNSKTK
jgi:hypothetical protein